ncbi:MAG TPA: DUF3500 domain-containing protein [Bryobacteraceae bacterium]|nr:DUF3500 domain-containing protein [Bryobacteraceae bacterium]
MSKLAPLALVSVLVCLASFGFFGKTGKAASTATPTPADAQTQNVVAATTAFLNSLTTTQHERVQFAFTAEKTATAAKFSRAAMGGKQGGPGGGGPANGPGNDSAMRRANPAQQPRPRPGNGRGTEGGHRGGPGMGPPGGFVGEQYGQAVWSNYPVSDVPRPGLALGNLSIAQRDAAMHLLQVALSSKGYQKILDIMGSDEALSKTGTPYCSGTACYTIGIFGQPSTTKPWMLEFGGHHLGLNLTMAGEHGVITPTLTGAQPAVYTSNGKTVRVLAEENDKAFALLNALDESERKQAILNYRVDDLVTGPGHAGETIQPEGLKAAAMNEKQRAMLLDVISEWAGIINDAYATPRMAEIKAGLDETYFAWSGPTTHEPGRNGTSYYRIQGPKLMIEFSPQGVGGDPTMHVHTMYRDPTNDYGRAFTNNSN